MKDKLEKFVQEHRDEMDHREPGDVWAGIEKSLPGTNSTGWQWMWKAAAILFFASTVGLSVYTFSGDSESNQTIAKAQGEEFMDVEDFYFRQISEKQGLIADLQEDASDGIVVIAELQKLDAMYMVLRQQYEENPTPEVVDALTLNLLVRIDLLNQTLDRLDPEDLPAEV